MTNRAQRAYDHLAPIYDRRWAHYIEETLRATLDGLDLQEADRVLDLATGTGALISRVLDQRPNLRVVGLDVSRSMLKNAVQRSTEGSWSPVQGDAARLPFEDGSFDAVLCASAFHIFPEPEAALGEMRRVLRAGGTLTLTDWCDDYFSCKLCALYLRLTDPAFHRAYSLDECRRMLERAGFSVASARRFKIDWLWGLMRLEARRSS